MAFGISDGSCRPSGGWYQEACSAVGRMQRKLPREGQIGPSGQGVLFVEAACGSFFFAPLIFVLVHLPGLSDGCSAWVYVAVGCVPATTLSGCQVNIHGPRHQTPYVWYLSPFSRLDLIACACVVRVSVHVLFFVVKQRVLIMFEIASLVLFSIQLCVLQ